MPTSCILPHTPKISFTFAQLDEKWIQVDLFPLQKSRRIINLDGRMNVLLNRTAFFKAETIKKLFNMRFFWLKKTKKTNFRICRQLDLLFFNWDFNIFS